MTPIQICGSSTNSPALLLERVQSEHSLVSEWYPLLMDLFPDEDDQEPIEQLVDRLRDSERNYFYLLREHEGRPIGIELRQMNAGVPGACYLPWCGVVSEYRGIGVYRQMSAACDKLTMAFGVNYVLLEVEDPIRIHVAYPDEVPDEVRRTAERRIAFWKFKLGALIARDPIVEYVRPASSNDQNIQEYDLLAVRPLDWLPRLWDSVFSADRHHIRKSAFRRFYLEMARLQYGNRSESDLIASFPAISAMLRVLDNDPRDMLIMDNTNLSSK